MEPTLSPYAELAIGTVAPSPTNPRKTFHDLEDLAASIREQGVMQPILARLWPEDYPTPEGRTERPLYEIIAGERRYRASLLAGLDTIPALVRVLNTRQVLEAQIVENLQRRDVTELEEAEGYQLMMRDHGYTADQLAEKVGKSRAYIYGRLKLCDMTEAPREAFRAGQIKASVALLIARLPTADLQERATACIVAADMSAREAAKHLQENNYMLQLERASWPLDEAFAGLPACLGCAFNSSTDREQHADISPNVCTNRECFGSKREAHLQRTAAQLTAQGHLVFSGDKARNLAPSGTDFYIHNGYVPVDRSEWLQGRHQTVAQAYGELLANVPRTWIEDIRTGALVECVSREHLWQLDRQAAAAKLSPEEVAREAAERDRKLHADEEAKQREEMENTFRNELLARTQTAYRGTQVVPDGALRALTRAAIRFEGIDDELAERYLPGIPHEDTEALEEAMHAKLDEAEAGQLLAILIDVMMPTVHRASRFLPGSLETPRELLELARVYGIDPDAVRGELGGRNADEDEPTAAPEETAPTPPQAPPGGDNTAEKPATGLAVAAEVSARLKLNAVPYRHPDNADLTWTGRGRKPAWVEAWLEDGGTLDDLSTPAQAAPAPDVPAEKPKTEPAHPAKQAAPAASKPKKEAATAAKKSKEKAKDSGRASPAERKGKTTAAPPDDAPTERDDKTIDLIDAHFPELASADQAQQEAAA